MPEIFCMDDVKLLYAAYEFICFQVANYGIGGHYEPHWDHAIVSMDH